MYDESRTVLLVPICSLAGRSQCVIGFLSLSPCNYRYLQYSTYRNISIKILTPNTVGTILLYEVPRFRFLWGPAGAINA